MHTSRLPWASLIDCIVIQINELGACSAGSAQSTQRPGGPSNWICTFIFFFHRLSSCAAAGFEKPRRGQRKSVYYCPTRLYPNKYTPIPYPLHVPTRQPSFSQTQKIFSQPHLCHRVTPPKTRHGKTLPYSDIKSTSSTAHCVPSQYPSTGLPQGLLPLQVAMPSDHDRISAASPSSSFLRELDKRGDRSLDRENNSIGLRQSTKGLPFTPNDNILRP